MRGRRLEVRQRRHAEEGVGQRLRDLLVEVAGRHEAAAPDGEEVAHAELAARAHRQPRQTMMSLCVSIYIYI